MTSKKRFLLGLALFVGAASATLVATDADARRLGGGGSAGMRRSLPPRQQPATPPHQAQPQTAPATSANPAVTNPAPAAQLPAVAPRRPWLAPLAGLAAGLGLAALASHFGFGEGLANAMTLLLLGLLAVVAIRFVLARLRPAPLGYAGPAPGEPRLASSSGGAAAAPASIDAADFARAAKLLFIRLQAANDAGDLDDLRRFTTPEMFAAARLDLQERRDAAQRTDVVQLDAELVDTAREGERDIASVRFHGLIREEAGGVAQPFDEVWHLVRPADASRDWAIAGIEQAANA